MNRFFNKTRFRQYGALTAISFLVGMVMPQFFGNNLQANLVNPYARADSWEEAVIEYHLQANELTNEFLKSLTQDEEPLVNFPGKPEACERDNVSTYCLGVQLSEELMLLESDLIERRNEFQVDLNSAQELEDLALQNASTSQRIDEEITSARESLELTLAVYNQAQLVYPIHREFEGLIANLERYRDALADVRDEIELYPSRFTGVTTATCK